MDDLDYHYGLKGGRLHQWEVMRELGYKQNGFGGYEGVDYVREYVPPPDSGCTLDVRNRMDPEVTKVYNHRGEQLTYVREYSICDRNNTGCVYVEFKDRFDRSYYFIGRDFRDIEWQIARNAQTYGPGHSISHTAENENRQEGPSMRRGPEMMM